MSLQGTLVRLTAVLVAVAATPAARVPGFPRTATALLLGVVLWRVVAGAAGGELIGRRARFVVQTTASVAVLFLLFVAARGRTPPVAAILILVTAVQAISLLGRQAPAVLFRLILLSTTQAAGAAFVVHDAPALLLALLYMLALTLTLLVFERRLAEARAAQPPAGRTWARAAGGADIPLGAWIGTLTGLAVLGLAAGGALYVAAPRDFALLARGGGGSGGPAPGEGTPDAAAAADLAGGSFTGPDPTSQGIRLGDVGTIKKDLTPYFEVTLPAGWRPLLRENTYDHFADATWTMSKDARPPAPLGPSAGPDGWMRLGAPTEEAGELDLELRLYRGTHRRFYLQRECSRFRVLRDGRPLALAVWRLDNEQLQLDPGYALAPEDRVEARFVPPPEDPGRLAAARSDAGTAPRSSFLQVPWAAAGPLGSAARRVVGSETNPYRRAQLLLDWFDSGRFTYTLSMPEVEHDGPVVDFVPACGAATASTSPSALTLMLRTLGHPARIARGFRGGDCPGGSRHVDRARQPLPRLDRDALRGARLDRARRDAAGPCGGGRGVDHAGIARRETQPRPRGSPASSRYGAERAARARGCVRAPRTVWSCGPVRSLFGARGGCSSCPSSSSSAWGWGRRRRRRRLAARWGSRPWPRRRDRTVPCSGSWPAGGSRRRRPETPREFDVHALGARARARSGRSRRLTALHEGERFGDAPPTRGRGAERRRTWRNSRSALRTERGEAQRGRVDCAAHGRTRHRFPGRSRRGAGRRRAPASGRPPGALLRRGRPGPPARTDARRLRRGDVGAPRRRLPPSSRAPSSSARGSAS